MITEKENREKNISELERKIRSLGSSANISKPQYEELAKIQKEIESLEAAIKAKDDMDKYESDAKIAKENRITNEDSILRDLEKKINEKLKELNTFIYEDAIKAPSLSLNEGKSYIYETANDDGTGHGCKDIIILDLALLELSKLPIAIHDTDLFNQIEISSINKILQLYKRINKQIFIAINKKDTFSDEAKKIVNDNKCIELDENHLLFGKKLA